MVATSNPSQTDLSLLAGDLIPSLLRDRNRWVTWRFEERGGTRTKVPYNPRAHRRASSTDPNTWSTFETVRRSSGRYDGVGIVLTSDDDLVGVDLDHCIGEDGEVEDWAALIVGALDSYTEITPSGAGLRVFCRGVMPSGGRKRGPIEMYQEQRYLTVTGRRLPGTRPTIEQRQAQIEVVYAECFPAPAAPPVPRGAPAHQSLELDDQELLRRAERAANGGRFARLWAGDTSEHGGDDSSADLALCCALAFWTASDGARVDRLFRQSGLWRPKWDDRRGGSTYGERTLARALAVTPNGYHGHQNSAANLTSNLKEEVVGGWVDESTHSLLQCDAADLVAEEGDDELAYLPLLGRDGFLVRGWSYLLAGYPRVGKTELLVASIRHWLETGDAVLLFTEEPRAMWRQRLRRFASWPRGLRLYFALGTDPAALLEELCRAAEPNVIVDTVRNLLRFEDENDNSEIARKINPWVAAARQYGKTLGLSHHMRKSSGDHGEGIAGGHALLGAVDIALEVVRDRSLPANRRKIRSYARLIQPGELLYDMTPAGDLEAIGEPSALARAELERRVLAELEEEWTKTADVLVALDEPRPSREALRLLLTDLARAGSVDRDPPLTGDRTAGKTVRWRRPPTQPPTTSFLGLEVRFDEPGDES